MTAVNHVITTVFFAALSPLYLLYIFALVVLAPFGLAVAKPFRRTTSKHHFSEYADHEIQYSLNEMFTFSGFKRVISTIFFALLSPLYLLYFVGLVFVAPIGLILSRFTKRNDRSDTTAK